MHIIWYAASPAASGFFTGPVVQGPEVDWQYPASLVVSTPRFLAAQRSAVSSLREEVAQRNPLEGVPLDASRNKRDRGPSGTPGLPGIEYSLVERCYVLLSALWSGVRQICRTRLGAKQISSGNFFARAVPLPTALGTPSPPQSPRKDFCRAKMPCGGERLPNLLPGSLIVERIAYLIAAAIQKESAGKNRRSARQGRRCLTRTTGIAQGSADPCVFTRQRKKQLLRGGSTPRFFAQLRSVGSKKNQLAGLCQNLPRTTGPAKKPPAAGRQQKQKPSSHSGKYPV